MRTFKHVGHYGDIIYSLPVMRYYGGGTLYIEASNDTKHPFGKEEIHNLSTLLETQDYVQLVTEWAGDEVAFDLSEFRNHGSLWDNIAKRHLMACDVPEIVLTIPWLEVEPNKVSPVVMAYTPRYRNYNFPWYEVHSKYKEQCVFVGTKDEHTFFTGLMGNIDFYETQTLLELAQVIAGSELFIGNQSCPYAIAEAMHKNTIQETCPSAPNCIFNRPNAKFFPGARVELPSL